MKIANFFKSKFFWGSILFALVFCVFVLPIKEIWFKLDDLGNIIAGIIKNPKDFIRVFSEDERNYLYPINFNVPQANFISCFYRPFQHIFFTIIYFLYGFNAYAYYVVNALFHAINAVLILYIFSFWMPLYLSFLGGLLFAFYPNWDWVTWICTLHNLLAIFFMFLSFIFFKKYLEKRNSSLASIFLNFLAGIMFLFSVCSRENTVFFGLWMFIYAYFLANNSQDSFWLKLKSTFIKTWIFFATYVVYFFLRLNASGYKSLARTYNNLLLKFPILTKFLGNNVSVALVENVSEANASSLPKDVLSVVNKVTTGSIIQVSWFQEIMNLIDLKLSSFWSWTRNILNIDIQSNADKIIFLFIVLFLMFFLFFSYKNHKRLFLVLFLGVLIFSWPGIVAYPNPRYLSAIYPYLVSVFVFGIYFFKKEVKKGCFKYFILTIVFLLSGSSVGFGIYKNVRSIIGSSKDGLVYKQKFSEFFNENSFDKNANFVVIGSPFVSDIQNVFQAFLNNLDLKLAFVRASTLAEKGSWGCRGDYRIKDVKSKIEKVKKDGKFGLRLISLDKKHCAWWMHFSHFPLKWSKEENAYIWTEKEPEVREWHDFSMGKFIIHERNIDSGITDVTYIFDDKWINKNTVFVTWDTVEGKYRILK